MKEEWEIYRSALEESGYFNSSVWLDIRGNHDNSNQDSSENHYYREYSTCGKEGPVFNKVFERPFGKYCFVGLDATLTPCAPIRWASRLAPGVMMTYFGYVPRVNQDRLRDILKEDVYVIAGEVTRSATCNHTVVFTHYPSIYCNSPALNTIYKKYPPSFVLSGHVHATLGNRANVLESAWRHA